VPALMSPRGRNRNFKTYKMKNLKFDLLCTLAVVCGAFSLLSIEQAIHLDCNGLLILAGLTALIMWMFIYQASLESRNQNKNK
jgi:hypothetical protein